MSWQIVNLYSKHHECNLEYVQDTRTDELYSYEHVTLVRDASGKITETVRIGGRETEDVIRSKAASIIIGLPFYTAAYSTYNLLKIPVDLVTCTSVKEIAMNVWNVVKAPFFAIAVFFAALFTLISPFEGRKFEAKIEKAWQNNVPFFKDFRLIDKPFCCGCHEDAKRPGAGYLAWCYQSRGLATDASLFADPV